jgi:RES domain-containing protein
VTTTAWRIVQAAVEKSAFSGEGAWLYPGRWNSRGTPVVYAAGSRPLAILEILVHLGAPDLLSRYVLIPVTFASGLCRKLSPGELPEDWRADPPPDSTRTLGTAWVTSGASPVLAVPSAVVLGETNYLLNPRHPDFGKLRIGAPEPYRFDIRLRKK